MAFFWLKYVLIFLIFVCLIFGKKLDVAKRRIGVKSPASQLFSYINARQPIQDEALKRAYMKEILKMLGMKNRPPPIPVERRKHNIPRPVYDGGIGMSSPDAERAKETQIVIAAEEGSNDSCNDEGACFRFKLNHALLSTHDIQYAALHVYNEAVEDEAPGAFKTIHLKEILHYKASSINKDDVVFFPASQDKETRWEKETSSARQAEGSEYAKSNVTNKDKSQTKEPDRIFLRDKEISYDPDFGGSEKAVPSLEKEGQGLSNTDRSKSWSSSKSITKDKKNDKSISSPDSKGLDESQKREGTSAKQSGESEKQVELISSDVFLQTGHWFRIQLKDIVVKWNNKHRMDSYVHALKLVCNNCGAKLKICKKARYRPFLVLKIAERKKRRKRRSYALNCIPGYEKCCRRKLYVNFKEINWQDWIIEPSGFEVNYCEGRCTGPSVISARSHAFVKQKLTRHSFLNICCVPVKFSSLTLLHFDEHGLIHKTVLKNMTVEECGCV